LAVQHWWSSNHHAAVAVIVSMMITTSKPWLMRIIDAPFQIEGLHQ